MRKNKGVTIVTLVIIVVILLILAGVSAEIGNVSISNHKDKILETEAREVQTAVISQYQKYLTVKDTSLLIGANDLQELGMENPKDTYIVKYNTGEVINKTTPQNSKGKEIHLKGN